jgi:sugar lactone lactonase YvrE
MDFPAAGALILSPWKPVETSASCPWTGRHQRLVPQAGDFLEFHEAPDVYCTNICFGGDGMRTAFITLSGTGRFIAVDWPRVGSLAGWRADEFNRTPI